MPVAADLSATAGLLDPRRTIVGKKAWDSEGEVQFVHAVCEAIRLSRADGRQPLSTGTAGKWSPKLLRQALRLVDDGRLTRRARKLLPLSDRPAGKSLGKPDVTAAVHGDWAELAVLQSGWHRGGPKLTVAYSDGSARLELEAAGKIIWSGAWQFELDLAGQSHHDRLALGRVVLDLGR